jgi:hypothetical protein
VSADLPTATRPATDPLTDPAPVSESARHLEWQRRQVSRRLVHAIAVPTALVAVLSAVMVGYYVYATLNSVLRPDDFAALRVGDDRARVARVLPRMEMIDSGARQAAYPEPRGADCRYYRADGNVLGLNRVYRLCFVAGRLSSKDVLYPPSNTDGTDSGDGGDGGGGSGGVSPGPAHRP